MHAYHIVSRTLSHDHTVHYNTGGDKDKHKDKHKLRMRGGCSVVFSVQCTVFLLLVTGTFYLSIYPSIHPSS